MLNQLIGRHLDAFGRAFKYDVSYMREILAVSRRAFVHFGHVQSMGKYREGVPLAPWYAAKLVATLREDCGPCTQLVADMALRDEVPVPTVRAVVRGRDDDMDADVRLACHFGRAVLAHDPAADELRAEVVARWGQRGLVSLAFAMTVARMYPTLKYALGHGRTCSVVRIEGRDEPAARTAA